MDRRWPQKPQGQSPTPNFQAETWKRKSPITEESAEEECSRRREHQGKGPTRGRSLQGTHKMHPRQDWILLLKQWEALDSSRQG